MYSPYGLFMFIGGVTTTVLALALMYGIMALIAHYTRR